MQQVALINNKCDALETSYHQCISAAQKTDLSESNCNYYPLGFVAVVLVVIFLLLYAFRRDFQRKKMKVLGLSLIMLSMFPIFILKARAVITTRKLMSLMQFRVVNQKGRLRNLIVKINALIFYNGAYIVKLFLWLTRKLIYCYAN